MPGTTRAIMLSTSPQAIINAADRALANVADRAKAYEQAEILLKSFPPRSVQNIDAAVWVGQITVLFEGYPVMALLDLINPKMGLASLEYLPTICELKRYLDARVVWIKDQRSMALRQLGAAEERPWEPVADEIRERQIANWRETKKLIQAATQCAMEPFKGRGEGEGVPALLKAEQAHGGDGTLEPTEA